MSQACSNTNELALCLGKVLKFAFFLSLFGELFVKKIPTFRMVKLANDSFTCLLN